MSLFYQYDPEDTKNDLRKLIKQCQSKGRSGWSMYMPTHIGEDTNMEHLKFLCTESDNTFKNMCDSSGYSKKTIKSWAPYTKARKMQWCRGKFPSLSLIPGSVPKSGFSQNTARYHKNDNMNTITFSGKYKDVDIKKTKECTLNELTARYLAGQTYALIGDKEKVSDVNYQLILKPMLENISNGYKALSDGYDNQYDEDVYHLPDIEKYIAPLAVINAVTLLSDYKDPGIATDLEYMVIDGDSSSKWVNPLIRYCEDPSYRETYYKYISDNMILYNKAITEVYKSLLFKGKIN